MKRHPCSPESDNVREADSALTEILNLNIRYTVLLSADD